MNLVHEFKSSLHNGRVVEDTLDRELEESWQVLRVSRSDERRRGIDRRITWKDSSDWGAVRYTLEIKADFKTIETNNVFFEVESSQVDGSPGWCLKSEAQILAYVTVFCCDGQLSEASDVFWLNMKDVKDYVRAKRRRYPVGMAVNEGYETRGILVPLSHVRSQLADALFTIDVPRPLLR